MTSTIERSVVEHNGCRFAYRVQGDGPPVLLIQGTGLHGDGWSPQIEGLAPHYRCLSFDNRGMGASQPRIGRLSVAQMTEDTCAVMDTQGWESAHVVGHSLGGLIALHLALTARKRVRSLALLCTFANGRDAFPLNPSSLWTSLRTFVGPRYLRRRAFLELVVPPNHLSATERDSLAAQLAPIFGHDLAEHPAVEMAQLTAMRAYNATPRLHELAGVATLVVSAAHDRIAPARVGRAMAAAIPGARYVEIADAAHGVPIQDPERVNGLLREHFAQVDGEQP